MKVLITGASGFIGSNLMMWLKYENDIEILALDKENEVLLPEYVLKADFIVHLAGVNRSRIEEDFDKINAGMVGQIVYILSNANKKTPILYSSSIRADDDSVYGRSKKQAEVFLMNAQEKYNIPVYIYRFCNVFGKWCRPNYNSVVSTFMYNAANNLELEIKDDPNKIIELNYIDDICKEIVSLIRSNTYTGSKEILEIKEKYPITLLELKNTILSFNESLNNNLIVNDLDTLRKYLFSTYLTYLNPEKLCKPLILNTDNRGSFVELYKDIPNGIVSLNTINPGFRKGNHFHHRKFEIFTCIDNEVVVKLKHIITQETLIYKLNEDNYQNLLIPPGYSHTIINETNQISKVIIYCNEIYNKDNSDTYFYEVD